MSAQFDEGMLQVMDFALDRIFDNPRRVGTPNHREIDAQTPTFWDLPESAQRIKVDEWLEGKHDPDGWVTDQFSDIDLKKLLTHFIAGDDLEIGRMVSQQLLQLGYRIERERTL